MSTEEIRSALISGELTGLILFGADPLRDFPDTPAWEEALTAADFVVTFSMHENATTAKADVVLPLETHAEKDGTVTHPDGRLQRVRPSASRPERSPPQHHRPLRASRKPRPRHRHRLPTHRLRSSDRSRPLLQRHRGLRHRRPRNPLAGHAGSSRQSARTRPGRRDGSPDTQRDAPTSMVQPDPLLAESRPASPSPTPHPASDDTLAPRHLPRPLGRPDHRAQPTPEVPDPPAARGDLPDRRRTPRPEERRGSPRQPERHQRRGRRSMIKERVSPGVVFMAEGVPDGQRQRAAERRPRPGEDREAQRGPRLMLPLADTQFAEATWIMVVKSIVIFAVIFGILPLLTVVERKLIGRFQHRYGPNRVGPYGLLQPLADVGKLVSKETFRPENAIPDPVHPRAAAAGPGRASSRWRSSPGATSRTGSASTASTSRSASSTSSPSARSPSTGCCSAAGPRAPNTASSGRCARPRS